MFSLKVSPITVTFSTIILLACASLPTDGIKISDLEIASVKANFNASTERYLVYNSYQGTFWEAWHLCDSFGLQLASITSVEDDAKFRVATAAANPVHSGPWWIAGTDLGNSKNFVWITTHKSVGLTGFENWAPNQPDFSLQNCLQAGYKSLSQWDNEYCFVKRPFVCEEKSC